MPRNYLRTLADIERRRKQGRGSGEGIFYKPWIWIHDLSPRSKSYKLLGVTVRRIHHLLSKLERKFFLLFDFDFHITDLREQFPLFPQESIIRIALEKGFRQPLYRGTKTPAVLTTDLLLTANISGERKYLARAIKHSSFLSKKRVNERLLLEQKYWEEQGIDWKVLTERQVPEPMYANLKWFRQGAILKDEINKDDLKLMFALELKNLFNPSFPLLSVLENTGRAIGVSTEVCVALFKNLTWHHVIQLDLNQRVHLQFPLEGLHIPMLSQLRRRIG